MPVAVGTVRGHQRHLVMIEKLIEIHGQLPFSGSALVSQSPACQRKQAMIYKWALA